MQAAKNTLKSISDDCLFALPSAMSTWDGCVKVWNDCVDFEQHWANVLRDCICRGVDGALCKEDFLVWDQDLDALVGRLSHASKLQERAFWEAMRLRAGLAKGDVVETESEKGPVLMQIEGGGLPRRGGPSQVRFTTQAVEPMCGRYISARVGVRMVQCLPEELTRSMRARKDIRPLRPDSTEVLALPSELFGEVLERMKGEINPDGFRINRRSTQLAFWHETVWRQEKSPWGFNEQDIIRVTPKSGRVFHVVYSTSQEKASMYCHNPKAKRKDSLSMLGLDKLPAKTNGFSLAVARSSFLGADERVASEAAIALAMRETSRAR